MKLIKLFAPGGLDFFLDRFESWLRFSLQSPLRVYIFLAFIFFCSVIPMLFDMYYASILFLPFVHVTCFILLLFCQLSSLFIIFCRYSSIAFFWSLLVNILIYVFAVNFLTGSFSEILWGFV